MKISPRDILIAAVVGILVVAVILVVLLILPQNTRLSQIDTSVKSAQNEISQAEALLAQRQQAKQRSAMTATELLALSNAVPENPELPSLIMELQDLAAKSGLQFRSLTPAQPAPAWTAQGKVPEPTYLRIPLKMQVFGTWSDTVDFLQRVQRLPRQLRITSVSAAHPDTPPPNTPTPMPKVPVLTEVGIEAYVVQPASAAGSAPAAAPAQ